LHFKKKITTAIERKILHFSNVGIIEYQKILNTKGLKIHNMTAKL
jgi:hypothetical protein